MIEEGAGYFTFADRAAGERGAIRVFTYRPSDHDHRCPVIILLHGSDRAAAYFRDCWAAHADRMRALLLVPCFDRTAFPGARAYNYGNVLGVGIARPAVRLRSEWSYGLIDRLFVHVRACMGLEHAEYRLFGHSAGAQFAHRYLALTEAPLAEVVVAGNSGWYMLPDDGLAFPTGTGGTGANPGHVERYLSRRLVLLLGDADIDPNDPGLPRQPDAARQGRTRLARGLFYFEHCRAVATRLGVEFGWQLSIAPGVGHRDDQIAGPAAKILGALAGAAA